MLVPGSPPQRLTRLAPLPAPVIGVKLTKLQQWFRLHQTCNMPSHLINKSDAEWQRCLERIGEDHHVEQMPVRSRWATVMHDAQGRHAWAVVRASRGVLWHPDVEDADWDE